LRFAIYAAHFDPGRTRELQPAWREVADKITRQYNGDATQLSRKIHALIELER
jgi:hypothetical protein